MAEILQFTRTRLPERRRRGPATILPFIGVRYERVDTNTAPERRPADALRPELTGLQPEL